jgi:hypothetical protein
MCEILECRLALSDVFINSEITQRIVYFDASTECSKAPLELGTVIFCLVDRDTVACTAGFPDEYGSRNVDP